MGIGVFKLKDKKWTGPPMNLVDYARSAEVAFMLPELTMQSSNDIFDVHISCDSVRPVTGNEETSFIRTSRSGLIQVAKYCGKNSESFITHVDTLQSFLESRERLAATTSSSGPWIVPWAKWSSKVRVMPFIWTSEISSTRYLRMYMPTPEAWKISICDFGVSGAIMRLHSLLVNAEVQEQHREATEDYTLCLTPSVIHEAFWKEPVETALPYREKALPNIAPEDKVCIGDGYLVIVKRRHLSLKCVPPL